MSVNPDDGRRRARHWPTGAGNRAKLKHADRLRVRELYAIGRVDVVKPFTARELGARFGVSHMTIRRIVAMDAIELEARRVSECNLSAKKSAGTSAPSS